MKQIELLAPAKDFQTALIAFDSGADAIYAGLPSFSARKKAPNLTIDELARLKNYAIKKKKKIYITLNTLIQNKELDNISHLLFQLDQLAIDAVIIQDIGLLQLIKKNFPQLIIHASTQMAIHSNASVEVAKNLGIKRIILSRELSFNEIKNIRQKHNDVELEVFIHGALCYSFSGMCLASGLILNRSGNRGECAQLCRNYYGIKDEHRYYFSCNDYCLAENILSLQKIGIHSLKIEGRMKDSDYVAATVKFYRQILDGKKPSAIKELSIKSAIAYSRKRTLGFFHHPPVDLINNTHSGHQGIPLGIVTATDEQSITVKLAHPLNVNDTLIFIKDGINKIRFNAFRIFKTSIKNVVKIQLKNNDLPDIGSTIFLIREGESEKKINIDYKKFPPYRKLIPIDITIADNLIAITSGSFSFQKEISIEKSDNSKNNFKIIFQKLLNQSGTSLFTLVIKKITDNNIFIRPSELKEFKRELYQSFENHLTRKIEHPIFFPSVINDATAFNIRKNLTPTNYPVPFIHHSEIELAVIENYYLLPLMPILKETSNYYNAIIELITSHPYKNFLIGINNIAHLQLFFLLENYSNAYFFLDFFTYLTNNYVLDFYYQLMGPKLLFGYQWIEGKIPLIDSPFPLYTIKDIETLPYFISLVCFQKHNFKNTECSACNKNFRYQLVNNKMHLEVIGKDCISYLVQNELQRKS